MNVTQRSAVAALVVAGTSWIAIPAAAQSPPGSAMSPKATSLQAAPSTPAPAVSAAAPPAATVMAPAPRPAATVLAPPPVAPNADGREVAGKGYHFLGLRYRGTIVPKFVQNLFVDEGKTIYSNTIGIEYEYRKDGFSIIPAISYTEYGTGDILYLQKNKDAADPSNWSLVNSSLKGVYLTADMLWSTQVSPQVAIEYGAGLGIGAIFGDLETTWVRDAANGPISTSNGRTFDRCRSEGDGRGCSRRDHQNASTAKVGRYVEPGWTNGGSRPNIFPYIAVPQFGVRYKPIPEFQARLGLGFSLTGFWFGLSGSYGFEKRASR